MGIPLMVNLVIFINAPAKKRSNYSLIREKQAYVALNQQLLFIISSLLTTNLQYSVES
ncbi:hypothetical protein Hanom_Chr16g01431781 [Helianthus anomalus]